MTCNLDVLRFQIRPNAPPWKSTVLHDPASGTVFVPAWLAGREATVTLCAGYDGVEAARYQGHPFVPHSWMAQNYPQTARAMTNIAESVAAVPPAAEED